MLILNKEQKQLLTNKIKFSVNFMMKTEANIDDLFNIRVYDADSDEVISFELVFKNSDKYMFMLMKSLSNDHDEYEIRFGIQESEESPFRDETTIRFFVSKDCNDNVDFLETVQKIFKQVTELEMEKQYQKLNNAIDDLLNY